MFVIISWSKHCKKHRFANLFGPRMWMFPQILPFYFQFKIMFLFSRIPLLSMYEALPQDNIKDGDSRSNEWQLSIVVTKQVVYMSAEFVVSLCFVNWGRTCLVYTNICVIYWKKWLIEAKCFNTHHKNTHSQISDKPTYDKDCYFRTQFFFNLYFMTKIYIYIYTLQGLRYPRESLQSLLISLGVFWTIQH